MSKIIFSLFLITVLSIVYVFQVAAQTKNESSRGEKRIVLDDKEPIHIGSGFTTPFSLGKPSRIRIPQVKIDLPVISAAIHDGHWEVSEMFANHGQGSANPGQNGNMVIFAHARPNLFFNLQNMTIGNDVYILTDKKWYAYTVSKITQVTPEQVEVIAPTHDEQVTLFTCSGMGDEQRFIVVGKRNTKTAFGLDESFMNLLQ